MKLYKDSDSLSLKDYYERHFEDLFHYAKGITNSDDTAKDAVSEVFLYLVNSKTDLNYVKNVKGYLLKSVKNSCIKQLTTNPLQLEYLQDDIEYQVAEEVNPQNLLLGKELEQFIDTAISELPPHGQLVFQMIRLQGMTTQEVSKELDISKSTVRNHLTNSVRIIREKLESAYCENPQIKYHSGLGVLVLALISSLELLQ